jgi:hypothetical protein
MSVQEIKLDILQKLMLVKEPSLLRKISKILDDEAVVAYTTSGKALTSKEYNDRLKSAEKQIISGKSISQDDLEREAENW